MMCRTVCAWFESSTSGDGVEWTTHWVDYDDPGLVTPGDVALAHINDDDKLDVVITCVHNGKVYWYENTMPSTTSR